MILDQQAGEDLMTNESSEYSVGSRVVHSAHGVGTVLRIEKYSRYSDAKRVFIRWDNGSEFHLIDPTLTLTGE